MKIKEVVIAIMSLTAVPSCGDGAAPDAGQGVPLSFSSEMYSAAVHNVNVLAYDSAGSLVTRAYSDNPSAGMYLSAKAGEAYYLYALANFGKVEAPETMQELPQWSLKLSDLDSLRDGGNYPLISLSAGEREFQLSGSRRLEAAEIMFSEVGTPFHVAVDGTCLKDIGAEVTSITLTQAAAEIHPFIGAVTADDGVYVQNASKQEAAEILHGGTIPFLIAGSDMEGRSPVLVIEMVFYNQAGVSIPKTWSYSVAEDSGEKLPLPWGKGYTLTLHLLESGRFIRGEWILRRNSQAIL